ncbi:hypothetical protein BU26DRAFT_343889 [Trematosphaeria pertusa]|uniref:F-box domain-containing protein n=1 Tax=Trematosphaeria pertusa TaxID=390896 RepID=A0A6A6IAY3_9PLEO|nr:uncharacterized protein BU26DRAFT_343889 [Trematosphaeria pertusa]KAF2247218.1 hypothetical protein BU26DRAFT_343889 [Trematosphaeria pertusa]
MARITDLPNELLVPIFENVWRTSPELVLALALSCKRLHQPARTVYYSHVCLSWKLNRNSALAKFASGNVGNEAVKSIRLSPQKALLSAFKVGMKNAFDHIDVLCACLSSLQNLATFSIFLGVQVDRRCLLPAPALSRIVRALPESVVNFELDTEGIDGIYENKPKTPSDVHLCHDISELLPRLETLRLRVSCMCTELFRSLEPEGTHQPASNLRLAAIKLELYSERGVEIPNTVVNCQAQWSGEAHRRDDVLRPTKLFDHLLRLQSKGAFPHLQRFILLSWSTQKCICIRDVASRTTTEYLCMSGRLQNNHWTPADKGEDNYMIRVLGRGDYYGGSEEVAKAIMHEVAWTEEQNGARLPPSRQVVAAEHRLDTSVLQSYQWT